MATYNSQILDNYFKSRDWNGAADYLSTLKAKGPKEQVILNNRIKELRKQGERQAAILQNMNTEQQNAFNFISAVDGVGVLPENNPYTSKYTELINELKVTKDAYSPGNRNVKGENIKTIRLDIYNDESFDKYLENIGTTKENISSLGIFAKQNNSDGHWLVDIPVNNLNVAKYTTSAYTLNSISHGAWGTGGGGYPFNAPIHKDYIIKGIELNGKPIGACGLKKIKNEEAEYWGYIGEKDCWGKGYGKAIIDFMIEIGKQKSLTSLYLNVIKANIRALGLYSKMGFVIEHEDENNIKMRLSL